MGEPSCIKVTGIRMMNGSINLSKATSFIITLKQTYKELLHHFNLFYRFIFYNNLILIAHYSADKIEILAFADSLFMYFGKAIILNPFIPIFRAYDKRLTGLT
jgi:hypothetical protein